MKKRRKPLILLGFPTEFLAFPRWFEHPTYRLGGGRSIQLSYGNIFKIYSIIGTNLLNVNRLCPKGGRYNIFLGGGRSIQLSYGNIFKIYSIIGTNLLNVNRLCPKGGRYNIFLGGPCYLHLTTETYSIFQILLNCLKSRNIPAGVKKM